MMDYSLKFIIGMILLSTNQIVGWAGVGLTVYLAVKTIEKRKKKVYYLLGTLIYAFSWVMVAAGMVMAGPKGTEMIRSAAISYRRETVFFLSMFFLGVLIYVWKKKKNSSNNPQT